VHHRVAPDALVDLLALQHLALGVGYRFAPEPVVVEDPAVEPVVEPVEPVAEPEPAETPVVTSA
jgi:hypothetical protein